jgi:hypothetical protein
MRVALMGMGRLGQTMHQALLRAPQSMGVVPLPWRRGEPMPAPGTVDVYWICVSDAAVSALLPPSLSAWVLNLELCGLVRCGGRWRRWRRRSSRAERRRCCTHLGRSRTTCCALTDRLGRCTRCSPFRGPTSRPHRWKALLRRLRAI